MKILSDDDNDKMHHQYTSSPIYCNLQTPLTRLQQTCHCPSPTDVWYQATKVIERLKASRPHAAAEVPRIYDRLCRDTRVWEYADGRTERLDSAHARLATDTILMVVCEVLENTRQTSENPRQLTEADIVPAEIINMIQYKDRFVLPLLAFLMGRKKDILGRDIVFPDHDPMADNAADTVLPSEKTRAENLLNIVLKLTAPLRQFFGGNWEEWESLWQDIVNDATLVSMLAEPVPRTRPLDNISINVKMICNVVGIFREQRHITASMHLLSDAISPGHNLTSYIGNHSCDASGNPTSTCVFSRTEYNKIKDFL